MAGLSRLLPTALFLVAAGNLSCRPAMSVDRQVRMMLGELRAEEPNRGQREVAEDIARLGPAAQLELTRSLKDPHPRVRLTAAWALGALRGSDLVDVWISLLKDPDMGVRYWAVLELRRAGDARVVEPLIGVLRDPEEYVDTRAEAAWAVAGRRDERAIDPLIEMLKDKDPNARYAVAVALGMMGDARAVEPLIALLKDKEPHVRREAVLALGKLGDARAIGPLTRLVDETDPYAAEEARKAIADIRAKAKP